MLISRIPIASYNETGGFNGNLTYVYDNYGNILDLLKDNGDPAKAILINPNNGAIDTRYNPYDIDDSFTYRARDGFMSIGDLWANGDGTVYLQGHPVIPNPWGNVSTNGTTTTTTTDITDKGGGDTEECCSLKDCCEKIREKQISGYQDWMGHWDEAGYISGYERGKNGFDCNEALVDYMLAKCDYLYGTGGSGDAEDNKEHGAWQQRYFAYVARWAGCKWATHPETTDVYDPVRVSYARRSKNQGHGWTSGTPADVNEECEKYAGC